MNDIILRNTTIIHKKLLHFLGPADYQKFIRYAGEHREEIFNIIEGTKTPAHNIINTSLLWDNTPEGWDYWSNISGDWRDSLVNTSLYDKIVTIRRPDTFNPDVFH